MYKVSLTSLICMTLMIVFGQITAMFYSKFDPTACFFAGIVIFLAALSFTITLYTDKIK